MIRLSCLSCLLTTYVFSSVQCLFWVLPIFLLDFISYWYVGLLYIFWLLTNMDHHISCRYPLQVYGLSIQFLSDFLVNRLFKFYCIVVTFIKLFMASIFLSCLSITTWTSTIYCIVLPFLSDLQCICHKFIGLSLAFLFYSIGQYHTLLIIVAL